MTGSILPRLGAGLAVLFCLFLAVTARAEEATKRPAAQAADCVVPARPAGGFDLTCHLVAAVLDRTGDFAEPTRISYLPGGVGAVAYNTLTGQRRAEPATLVAFSEGSIYHLVLGRYGKHDLRDVQWIAALALDHGTVVVRQDAPWADLKALMQDIARRPGRIAIGGGGSIGGQDWMRAARTVEAAGVDPRQMRFVAFEGGGDCIGALLGGNVQVCLNDVADSRTAIDAGDPLRILAVNAAARLPGDLGDIPTAAEQGYPIDWPVLRGVYAGPDVPPEVVAWWRARFAALADDPAYPALAAAHHLEPLVLTGPALEAELARLADTARSRAARYGIAVPPAAPFPATAPEPAAAPPATRPAAP